MQHARYAGNDSRSSENQKKSRAIRIDFCVEKVCLNSVFVCWIGGKQSDLNKTKTSDKKQKLKTIDDTKQPGKQVILSPSNL